MTTPQTIRFAATDLDAIAGAQGRVAVAVTPEGKMDPGARRVNRLAKGALARLVETTRWEKAKPGDVISLAMPVGFEAEALDVICLPRRPSVDQARRAGAELAKVQGGKPLLVLLGATTRPEHVALGLALRAYAFTDHRTSDKDDDTSPEATVMVSKPDEAQAAAAPLLAVAEGVFFTRDLVNEPANILTTTEFADRLTEMQSLGLTVEVLEESDMQALGMGSLLSVGQGSDSPSKLVVMRWDGGAAGEAPLALVGKGVVFDTGGISLKPAAGMEDMTMDMGGAGVVAGVMRALALRKARANVVGLVGLVENMPSGNATRPGDVVKSMKGDTIEVINTDAEGRLVLADVMWYAQEKFSPRGMIDLATLTGACIIALGHENAAVFSNNDDLAGQFLKAAQAEGEGAWRLPLGKAYDDLIKSPIADMKNVGGRTAGSITAAQFLQRFVKDDCAWVHLDIAGVTRTPSDSAYAAKGVSGWGVMALNRLIADTLEG
ncbi:leucyl aminopeptidase [Lacimonas salitolerans]|uniref:Probable cytosol aminopeptidase n=1 Tax=Lacimonas salitolerans TaxID=1323750 RepID=A0ABW4EC82_9RHOB